LRKTAVYTVVNEDFERIFNAVFASAVVIQRVATQNTAATTIIKMERRLEKNDHSVVAKVTYKKSSDEKDGKWLFFGWAAC